MNLYEKHSHSYELRVICLSVYRRTVAYTRGLILGALLPSALVA